MEITQEKAGESSSRKSSLSRQESKTDSKKSSAKEKNSAGTPEKQLKSKSPDKTPAAVEPFEKTETAGENSEVKRTATAETTNSQGNQLSLIHH